MKKILLIGIMILLPLASSATIRNLTSADLPYTTQATGDTLRISGTRITGVGDGITVIHSGILIDGQNDTLFYGAGGGSAAGINVNSHHLTVRNLWLIQDGNGDYSDGIKMTHAAYNLTLQGVKIKSYGVIESHCIDSYGSGSYAHNLIIDTCRFWNYCTGYPSRMSYGGAAVRLELRNPNLGPDDWAARVYGSTVYIAAHCGFTFLGYDGDFLVKDLEVSYCSTFVDHQNTMYPVFDGTTGHSSANAYGFLISYAGGGLRFHHNYIGAGSNHGGSRGLMLEGIDGSPTDTAKIYSNVINIHCGPDVNYCPARNNYVAAWAVRLRDIDAGTGEYIELFDNDVTITLDTNSTVGSAYGYWGCAFNLSETKTHDGHINVYNNRFEVVALHVRSETDGEGVRLMATPYDETIKFYNNHIIAPTKVVWFYSGAGIEFSNDTLEFAANTINPRTFFMGFYNGDNTGNIVNDAVYLNGATYNNIYMVPSGTADISIRKSVSVFVRGYNEQPVAGASVWMYNNYGTLVLSGTTNSNGLLGGTVTYWREQLTGPDSVNYNNFTVKAKYNTDSTIITYAVDNINSSPVVTLSNTQGQQGDDTIAPERIDDLGLLNPTGSSVTLTWTAPGDDGAVGTAAAYDARYSTSTISAGNWSFATPLTGVPAPKPAGSGESFLVSGLPAGNTYFFGIRARDELHNWSEISNVVSWDASGVSGPDAIADLNAVTGFNAGEILLTWTAVGESGNVGTAAGYEVRYSSSYISEANWVSAAIYGNPPTPLPAGTEMSLLMQGLQPGELYFIAVKARDGSGIYAPISNVASAVSQTDIALGDDSDLYLISPRNGAQLFNSQPYLVVSNINSYSQNVYTFQLDDDTGFASPIAQANVIQQGGGSSSWKVPSKLNSNQIYYWRAQVNGEGFTDFETFSVTPSTHVYPNPFELNIHETATFTELPENAGLIIMTVSGMTVRQWSNIVGGEVTWDGTNESGKKVASGTYLWFVEDSDLNGKLVVKR